METEIEKGTETPVGKGSPTTLDAQAESEINIIRTETVLSKLPRHILSKSGKRPEIRIEKFTPAGKLDLRWVVSFNELYGPARQLAYDLDTLIVERAIEETFDEARRNGQQLPRLIPIGSLRDLCRKLNLEENGPNVAKIKRALQQNAGAVINTVLSYRGNDGTESTIDGTFTCYGVFFTGKKLPDGRKAEQTYISTTNEYHQVISTAPTRPLDYSYKQSLPPTPRRLYEILSFPMYGAIKNKQPHAKLLYSDYCMRAPHVRYFTFDQVKKQMHRVNKPHRESGYFTSVKYELLTDSQGKPDWMMLYAPGPKAYAEFVAAHPGHKVPRTIEVNSGEAGKSERQRSGPRQRRLRLEPTRETIPVTDPKTTEATVPAPEIPVNAEFLSALVSRGIAESAARELLSKLKPDQQVIDQLEWGEHQVRLNPDTYKNPAGFYIYLIRENLTVPESFETSRKRAAREAEARRRAEEERLQREYELYRSAEIDRYITEHGDEFAAVKETKAKDFIERYGNDPMFNRFATIDARVEIGKKVPMLTFDEFVKAEKAIAAAQLSNSQVSENDLNQPVEQELAKPAGKDEFSTPEHQTPALPHEGITPKPDSETTL